MTPGIQPRIVRQMLMRKSAPQPLFRKTARGGMKIATRYANTSACEKMLAIASIDGRRQMADRRQKIALGRRGITYGR